MDYELIRRALNHSSGGGVTSQYITTQVETLRPIFQAVAEGYHDPNERIGDGIFAQVNGVRRAENQPLKCLGQTRALPQKCQ